MSGLRLVPFEPAHLDRFDPGSFDRIVLDPQYFNFLRARWPGHALAATRGGRTLGITGAVIIGTCAHPWVALSDEFRRDYPVLLTKLARAVLRHLINVDGADRIVVTVDPDFVRSRRWLERLGFKQTKDQQARLFPMSAEGFLLAAKVATQVISEVQQTRAESKAARFQAAIAHQQAAYQRILADAEAARLRRRANRDLGRQITMFSAAGIDPGSGSALLAQQSLAGEAELEALAIRNGGAMRAAELENSAALTLHRARASAQQRFATLGTRLLADL